MDYETNNHKPNADILEPVETRLDSLQRELSSSRAEAADAIRNLADYRRAVRATVIENVRNGTICRPGANEALEEWGDEPYQPRYTVTLQVDVEVTLNADSEEEARSEARNCIAVDTGEYERYVDDVYIKSSEEIGE